MGHDKLHFEIPAKTRNWCFGLMGLGVLSAIVGGVADETHGQYWWAVLLICGFFFLAVSLGALFFYALQYAAEVAWTAQIKRVFEAMFSFIPVGLAVILVVLLAGQFHLHHIYHWMDHSVYEEGTPTYDKLIADKAVFFGAFFWVRIAIYVAGFVLFARAFRKWSLQEDESPSTELHLKQYRRGALFLVYFAVFSTTIAWDLLMSIDTHWFSTMYSWYIFSGMWVTCMIFATLLIIWLKGKGYFTKVNDSHIHDMGKWMFAISMLWSYLWFCQFMLIWYSDIPEEVTYFKTRYDNYMGLMWGVFFANFAIPFYVLIARDAKRNIKFLQRVGAIIFVTHFLDIWMAVVPGTNHGHEFGHHPGFAKSLFHWSYTFGIFLGFLGLFIFIVLRTLSKAKLVPVNHPYLNESENHHI